MAQILSSRDTNDMVQVSDEHIEYLNKLGNNTYLLLNELIIKYGPDNIHIVTNSLNGWIKDSLYYASCITKLYKDIELLLIYNDITMISAQSIYAEKSEKSDHSTPTLWKQLCFADILKEHETSSYSHILSIGDQWTDHYA